MNERADKPITKPLVWMGDSLEAVRDFPPPVKGEIGFALYQAQIGKKHVNAKPMKGLGSGVFEIISDCRSDTFRAVYMVKLIRSTSFMLFRRNRKAESPRPSWISR
jgi:phage-related protein